MTDIGKIGSGNYNPEEIKHNYKKDDIELEDISILYTTKKTEDQRGEFDTAFSLVNVTQSSQGEKFINSLKNNKTELMDRLNLTDEQYDSLACVSLGLASQETGMGEETEYVNENSPSIGKWFRDTAKNLGLGDGSSASSGITQMKIYEFLNDSTRLAPELQQILKDYGVVANGKADNNLFDNPDKAAVATMVVLKSINDNYDNYTNMLKSSHEKIAEEIAESPEKLAELEAQGHDVLNNILGVYKNATDSQKIEIRNGLKMWLLAQNGSTKGQRGVDRGYNEEENLETLNKILKNNDPNFEPLTEETLHYIRYALTGEGQQMTPIEYMAYGWNKGTGATGMQLDRTLADKVGTILFDPEEFDYDQFTTNVSMLAEKYGNQSLGQGSLDKMNEALLEDFDW